MSIPSIKITEPRFGCYEHYIRKHKKQNQTSEQAAQRVLTGQEIYDELIEKGILKSNDDPESPTWFIHNKSRFFMVSKTNLKQYAIFYEYSMNIFPIVDISFSFCYFSLII